MKLSTYCLTLRHVLILVFLLSSFFGSFAQEQNKVLDAYNNYTETAREVAYLHLNKSNYITGETIGFSAYVIDKASKKPSSITTNLYCIITNKNSKVIKEQLVKINNGVGSGTFDIDSTFTSGTYGIKAYTQWMKNFDENNHFAQKFSVIDVNNEDRIKPKSIGRKVDAQFLPEGGHLLANTNNVLGVTVKDTLGFGVPNVTGEILDSDNNPVGNFKTNQFGIGKFLLLPKGNSKYKARLKVNNLEQEFQIEQAEIKGVCMSLSSFADKIALSINTNEGTLPVITGKQYKLGIHNGKSIKMINVAFADKLTIKKVIASKDLFSGINVITLFDQDMNPLLERLYFNHSGVDIISSSENYEFNTDLDSINITIPINLKSDSKSGNFSISVLPEDTKSYKHHHNIISYSFLKPFVNGIIENAQYYFKAIDRKKKYELDNLLITQGWSSYDWNTIFKGAPKIHHNFENGISLLANINQSQSGQYVIFPTKLNTTDLVTLKEDEKQFALTGFYPLEGETIKIGAVGNKDKVDKPSLYVQFGPSKIPYYSVLKYGLPIKQKAFIDYSDTETEFKNSWEKVEELNQVIVTTNKKEDRLERLKKSSYDQVDIFDDEKRRAFNNFASYIITKGFNVRQNFGSLVITNPRATGSARTDPLVFLDGVLLSDLTVLYNFDMSIVDYIQVNRLGFGEGIRGNAGSIKIFTDPSLNAAKIYGTTYEEYEPPLTFSSKKRFYTPVYSSYTSDFYKAFGVIGWIANATLNDNQTIDFTIFDTKKKRIKVFIEGMTSDGSYLSEEKIINLN